MIGQTQFLRAFYEIAASIGGTLELEIMCRAALNAYHRKLDCHSSAIVCTSESGHWIYITAGQKHAGHTDLTAQIGRTDSSGSLLLQQVDDYFSHSIFALPGFGAIILTHEKNSAALEYLKFQQDLIILNHNFAAAAIACLKIQDLKNAETEAQKALKIKSNFLANVSHELRTPLNAIIGFAGLLQRKNSDEKQQEFCLRINESAQLLMTLINDMLDFNSLEDLPRKNRYQSFYIKHEFTRLLAPLKKFAEVKGLHFSLSFNSESDYHISTDIKRLAQVITKIADNAVKFCSAGDSIHIQCSAHPVRLETREYILNFTITDTGPGIPQHFQNALFEPFQKDPLTKQNKNKGVGLGLALCKKVISHMGGEIMLKPSVQGCHIEFTWPCLIDRTWPLPQDFYPNNRQKM